MNVKSLALGLAVGFLAGWIAFETGTTPTEEPPTRTVPSDHHPSEPDPAPPSEFSPPPENATLPSTEPEASPREQARNAIARLDAAVAGADETAFERALHDLCEADHDSARERLLALITDESLPDLRGSGFVEAFHDSDLPGIAAAARSRFEMNTAAEETSWVAASGWFDLVARHGTEGDIDWLLTRKSHRNEALRAIARSSSPASVARFEQSFREATIPTTLMSDFRSHSPDRAFELMHEMIRSGDWRSVNAGYAQLLRHYGACAPEERLAEVRATLLAVTDPQKRLAIVYAMEALRRRELDTSGFQPILEAPIEVLEGPDSPLKSTARYSVEYNEVAWSDRAAQALEGAGFESEAAQVRARLRSPFRGRNR